MDTEVRTKNQSKTQITRMNKIGDIVGGKVVFSPDVLLIPEFKKLWEATEDKAHAHNLISYIVFKHKFDSPYVIAFPEKERHEVLSKKLFGDGWAPSELVIEAEKAYVELSDSLMLRLLRSYRKKLDEVSEFLDRPSGDLDMKTVKEILASGAVLDKVVKSVNELESKIKLDQMTSSTARGGGKIGMYEMPRK